MIWLRKLETPSLEIQAGLAVASFSGLGRIVGKGTSKQRVFNQKTEENSISWKLGNDKVMS